MPSLLTYRLLICLKSQPVSNRVDALFAQWCSLVRYKEVGHIPQTLCRISCNWVVIPGKRHCFWVHQMYFLALWFPHVQYQQAPLYWRKGRHDGADSSYPQKHAGAKVSLSQSFRPQIVGDKWTPAGLLGASWPPLGPGHGKSACSLSAPTAVAGPSSPLIGQWLQHTALTGKAFSSQLS